MSAHARTLASLKAARVIAVVRTDDAATAVRTAEALLEGGIRAIELTLTTPGVERALAHLAERRAGAVLGLGSITTRAQAAAAVDWGAEFLVSPASTPGLIEAMVATGLATVAGCLSPTETLNAHERGAHAIKLFPADTVGPAYLTHLRGPFPHLQFIPTGGIRPSDVGMWIEAGALAVGLGGRLARPVRSAEDRRAVAAAALAATAVEG